MRPKPTFQAFLKQESSELFHGQNKKYLYNLEQASIGKKKIMKDKDFSRAMTEARELGSPDKILEMIPYSAFIGTTAKLNDGKLTLMLDRRQSNIGNPSLPAIHGGVIAGFLELTAIIEVLYQLQINDFPKVIDFSLDYLRPARYKITYADCVILRQGNRLVNTSVTAWQDDRSLPVASARCHFLIKH